MPEVKLATIIDNGYRDRTMFPTDPIKINALKESIDQTGFWDNIMGRLRYNELADGTVIKDHVHLQELLDAGLDLSKETIELSYGHHRLDALREMGYDVVTIPIKWISDEDMLRIMSNENKEGWGAGIKSKLETVRQVKGELEKQVGDCTGFADYQDTHGDKAVFSKKQFQDAKGQGIGYRTVQAFLGASWAQSDIRVPMSVFKAIEKRYFSQDRIIEVPSMGLLDGLTACIVAMYEGGRVKEMQEVEKTDKDGKVIMKDGKPEMIKKKTFVTVAAPVWPNFYKDEFVSKMIVQCIPAVVDDDAREEGAEFEKEALVTQNMLNKRRLSMLAKGSAPTTNGSAAFRVHQQLLRDFFPAYISDAPNEERQKLYNDLVGATMDTFKATEGIANWAGLEEAVGKLQDTFEVLLTPLEEVQESDLQTDMEKDETTSESYEASHKDLNIQLEDDSDEDSDVAVATPVGQVSADVIAIIEAALPAIDNLSERYAEVDFEADPALYKQLRRTIGKVAKLIALSGGLVEVNSLFSGITEALKADKNVVSE